MATKRACLHLPRRALGAITLLMLTHALYGASKDTVPDRVHQAAQEKLPAYPVDTNAVVLLDNLTYTVGADGKAVQHELVAIRILRPEGRDFGIVQLWHNKDSKINYLHVWSIGPDGHEYAVKNEDIAEVGSYEGTDLYSDDMARMANAPARDIGAVIAYEYEQRCVPYFTELTQWTQQDVPIHKMQITLKLPPGFSYTASWKGRPEVPAVPLGNNAFQWGLTDVPAVDLRNVPLAPSLAALLNRVTLHYFSPNLANATQGDWKSVGQATWRLNEDRIKPTPEITAKALELTAGKTDFAEKVMALYQYVQDFRYYDIALGIGGNQPHYAAEIFQHKYGDCKDKSTILTSMLAAVGIHSAPVIVDDRRGVISPESPSEDADHQINAIELPVGYESPLLHTVVTAKNGKRYLIADATYLPYTPFGDIEGEVQGSYAFIADADDSQLIQIPVLDPKESSTSMNGSFTVSPDNTLTGNISNSFYGDSSYRWRSALINLETKKKRDYVQDWLSNYLPNFTLASYDSSNLTTYNKDLQVKINFSAANYARAIGPMLLVRPCVVGKIIYRLDTKPRKYPIDMGEPRTATSDFTIQLPDGYKVDDVPDPVKVDTGFASYESKTVVQGNTVHYTRTFVERAVELPPEKYEELKKLMEIINNDERSEVVLKKSS